ncbi:MAG: hypothetical protein GEU73_04895 [Chloroflexi bacterium]|nr:hypothetical protein [Chloroflexota bacterium]
MNPIVDRTDPLDGEWIVGIGQSNGIRVITEIRVADQGDSAGRDISGAVHTVPSSESKRLVQGATHNLDGTIQGRIKDFGGVTALEYLTRLHDLISNQHRYLIIVTKRNQYVPNAKFHTRYDWDRVEGTDLWDVSLSYVSLDLAGFS